MDSQIAAVFCQCDDMLKALHHDEDRQCQLTDNEVMTTEIIAALHFSVSFDKALELLGE